MGSVKVVWKDELERGKWAEHPVIRDGCVYVPWCHGARKLVEYDAETGEVLNLFTSRGGLTASPIVLEDYIFAYSYEERELYKVDRRVWRLLDSVAFERSGDFECLEYNPNEDLIYVVTHRGIEAYNSGLELVWVFEDHRPTIVEPGSPLLVGDVLYHRSPNGWFYALDASTGGSLWSVKLRYSPDNTYNNPIYDRENERIYIADTDPERRNGNVYSIDLKAQSIDWIYPISNGCVTSTLTYHNGVVYVPLRRPENPGSYVALNAHDGSVIWERAGFFNEDGWTATAVDGRYLYRMTHRSDDPHFIVQDISNGSLVTAVKTAYDGICSNPIIWGGNVYVGSSGCFYCFKVGEGSKDRDVGFHGEYRTGYTTNGVTSHRV